MLHVVSINRVKLVARKQKTTSKLGQRVLHKQAPRPILWHQQEPEGLFGCISSQFRNF
jgi:hypothetical protein